jgi:hypothetical protein
MQQEVNEVPDDEVWAPLAPRDDATQQDACIRIPFQVDGTVPIRQGTSHFGPSVLPPRPLVLGHSQIVAGEL